MASTRKRRLLEVPFLGPHQPDLIALLYKRRLPLKNLYMENRRIFLILNN